MSDYDWAKVGWHHADIALSYTFGALAYIAALLAVSYLLFRLVHLPLYRWATHRARVWRLHRDARRAGRDANMPMGNGGY